MRDTIVIIIRLGRPGGLRSVVAESVLMRSEAGSEPSCLGSHHRRFVHLNDGSGPVLRSAIVLKPSTLLHFHKMLTKKKYRLLFSPKRVRRPGPKGPATELIDAVVEMKRRNSAWGFKRIAQQIALAFGVDIDKDVVRRILGIHFRPEAGPGGPSWLSFIGHAKDSLLSLDLLRCESATLRTYWILAVMDQFTRRIVGFAVHRGVVDGMLNRAITRLNHFPWLAIHSSPQGQLRALQPRPEEVVGRDFNLRGETHARVHA